MDGDIQSWKTKLSTVIPLAFYGRRSVNFGFLTTTYRWLMFIQKIDFLEDHVSAPEGCCALKFLHVIENDQVLLAHTPSAMGVPNIIIKGIKKCLEI